VQIEASEPYQACLSKLLVLIPANITVEDPLTLVTVYDSYLLQLLKVVSDPTG